MAAFCPPLARALIHGLMLWMSLSLAATAQAREVVVQLKWHHQFQFAGYYAALHQGYYEAADLDVTLRAIRPDVNLVDEVVSGRADFAISNSGLLKPYAQGEPVVALAAILQHSPGVYLGVAGRNIASPSDLIGARVMVPQSIQGGELVALLKHLGMLGHVRQQTPSFQIQDLIDGRTDLYNAYLSNEPFELIQRGLEPMIINPRDFGVDFYSDVLFTRRALIDDEPEMVEAFRAATIRGWHYALTHKDELIRLIRERYAPNSNPEKLRYEANTLETLMLSNVVDIGHMSRVRWLRIRDQLAGLGMIPGNLDLEPFLYRPQVPLSWATAMPWVMGTGTLLAIILCALTWVARHNLHLSREIGERRRAEAKAFYLATHDPLTDLPNRALMTDRLQSLLDRARREQIKPALLFMDLDNFKTINDTLGHEKGDDVLKQVAYALRLSARSTDHCARFAGDEFVVLLDDCRSEEDARQVADKLRQAILSHYFKLDLDVPLGVSIGVLWINRDETVGTLLRMADQLMYQAKRRGRNFNQVGRSDMDAIRQRNPADSPDA